VPKTQPEFKPTPEVKKEINQAFNPPSFGGAQAGVSIANLNKKNQSLGAQKLDVNFDNDDFFNSFGTSGGSQKEEKKTNKMKLQEVEDPFMLGQTKKVESVP